MESSDAQDKLHGSSELQEAGFSKLSSPKEDAVLASFLEVLQRHSPARGREAGNYKRCLGMVLARGGLPVGELSKEVFESLALSRSEYFTDLLQPGDIEKIVRAFGVQRTGELFLLLYQAFHREALLAWGPRSVNGRPTGPEEMKEARAYWLVRTRDARFLALQGLVDAAAASAFAPVEWLLELVDLEPLRRLRS